MGSSSGGEASSPPPPESAAPVVSAAPPPLDWQHEVMTLRKEGFPEAAAVIEARVNQPKPKMKMTPEQGAQAAAAARQALPRRAATRALLAVMPKTAVELVRAVSERAVPESDAEAVAGYLKRFHEAMKMENPEPFDENCSHVMGRHWHEIETYQYEGMSWERQKKIYDPKGVGDFRTEGHVRRFFEIESRAPYFQKLYQPKGGHP